MTRLEKEVGTSATVPRITELVAAIPSESVKAPRELSQTLRQRLSEVAAHHGGQVPLHGRLFAQWLHHAYPLECPYPHEAGVKNVQAWTGGESDQASESEMKQHVDADTCSVNWEGKIDCGEEAKELPWSTTEELLQSGNQGQGSGETKGKTSLWFRLLVGLLGLTTAAVVATSRSPLGPMVDLQVDSAIRSAGMQRWHVAVGTLVLTAFGAGLLDPMVLAIATLGGLVAKFAVPGPGSDASLKLPTSSKAV